MTPPTFARRLLPLLVTGLFAGPALAQDWTLKTVNGTPAVGAAVVRFAPDGAISGSTGCNRFHTKGSFADGTLTLGTGVAMTRMACTNPAVAAQERSFTDLFQDSVAISFNPLTQELQLKRGDTTLVFLAGSGTPMP